MGKSTDGRSDLSQIKETDWKNIKWVPLCKKCAKSDKNCVCNKADEQKK